MGKSKKFRGKRCAYCGEGSTGADHVIARGFFLPEDRNDLPQVPTCAICNGAKSKLETDLMAVLPFGARHASAERNMREMVPGRLEKNRRVHRQLGRGQGRTWVQDTSGLIVQTMTLPVDPSGLLELHKWIARGLAFYHWEVQLTNEHDVTAVTLTQAGEEIFERQFALNAAARVEENLKNGTFWYQGARAVDDESVTIWRFSMYGNIHFGDPNLPGEVASRIGVLTGPRSIARRRTARSVSACGRSLKALRSAPDDEAESVPGSHFPPLAAARICAPFVGLPLHRGPQNSMVWARWNTTGVAGRRRLGTELACRRRING